MKRRLQGLAERAPWTDNRPLPAVASSATSAAGVGRAPTCVLPVDGVPGSAGFIHLSRFSGASFLEHREQGVANQSVECSLDWVIFAGCRQECVK
jgi:hypothetical protein